MPGAHEPLSEEGSLTTASADSLLVAMRTAIVSSSTEVSDQSIRILGIKNLKSRLFVLEKNLSFLPNAFLSLVVLKIYIKSFFM